jgi:hypothetical protein
MKEKKKAQEEADRQYQAREKARKYVELSILTRGFEISDNNLGNARRWRVKMKKFHVKRWIV